MASKCPRCTKTVYMAEEVAAVGQKWHKMCFKCATCNKSLDSTTVADKDGEIFCKSCYGRNFGPKGYGYGGGAGTLSMEGSSTAFTVKGPAAGGPVTTKKDEGEEKSEAASESPATTKKVLGTDVCPRCEKKVYMAEKVLGAGYSWHKSCFRCKTCSKNLDSTTCQDKDSEVYCKGCYAKNFGPKGYGYGGGAGALVHTN
eukprot:comp21339_c0_seq1/m.29251 comp21339_c0_seq1/g.29251  ORF comp21339_c0_seq1/g.29251 comp21339_c0_seq1/m.29251 type:complete len:200 (-) comp21339_c0_seq1:148-747(-)